MTTGDWPTDQIDHINGDKGDNRIANLREATNAENNRNTGAGQANTSGFKGVCWDKAKGKWRAQIEIDGRGAHLGYFTTPEAAYVASAAKHHG